MKSASAALFVCCLFAQLSRSLHFLLQFDAEAGGTPKILSADGANTPAQILCEIPRPNSIVIKNYCEGKFLGIALTLPSL
jgi:hypothetical protein